VLLYIMFGAAASTFLMWEIPTIRVGRGPEW